MSGFSSRAVQVAAVFVLLYAARVGAQEPLVPAPAKCPTTGSAVTVITERRELLLCQQGEIVAKFRVAFGRGGLDKRRAGDGRTPLGTYALGTPRSSSRYGLFIPIDYPTPEQVAQGFTGGNIGIHGPPRGLTADDYPITPIDWTQGCIATSIDADIAYIADFVVEHHPSLVIR